MILSLRVDWLVFRLLQVLNYCKYFSYLGTTAARQATRQSFYRRVLKLIINIMRLKSSQSVCTERHGRNYGKAKLNILYPDPKSPHAANTPPATTTGPLPTPAPSLTPLPAASTPPRPPPPHNATAMALPIVTS